MLSLNILKMCCFLFLFGVFFVGGGGGGGLLQYQLKFSLKPFLCDKYKTKGFL